MTLRKEEQAGGAEILLASLTGAKRVSLLEAAAISGLLGCGCFWPGQDCVVKRLPFHQLAGRIQGP